MAIQIKTHLSQVGGRGMGGAAPVRAGADSFGMQSAQAGMELGHAVSNAGKALDKIMLERKSADMLEKENELRDKLREFDTRYRSEKQGKNALSAEEDYRVFIDDEISKYREGVRDPRVLRDFDRRMGSIRGSTLDHAASYRLQQENKWKVDTLDAQGIAVTSLASNPDISDEEKTTAFEDYQRNTQALFPGLKEARMAENEEKFKAGVTKAHLTRLENQIKRNPAEAMSAIDAALAQKLVIGKGGNENEPRGIRNNNPGNIRINARNAWQGAVKGTDESFVTFATPEHGIRAVGRILTNYSKNGIDTVDGIISKWAPENENDTGAYIKRVAESLGVSPTEPLDLSNPETLAKLTKAIITHENGKNPYSDETIMAGTMAALGQGGATDEVRNLAAYLPEKQLAVMREAAKAEINRRDAEKAATEGFDVAMHFLERVKNGEDYADVHKDILGLQPKMRATVNQLFQASYRDWQNVEREKAFDAVIENRSSMTGMTIGKAYTFVQALPESTPLERTIKKQAQTDYAVAAQHGGLHKTTDPNRYADLVEAVGYAEVSNEKELRAHPYAASIAEKDLKKLLDDIKGSRTLTEKSLLTAYRWAIGNDENTPEGGRLSDTEKRDFMQFSDWAQKTAAKTARAGEPEYARTLARIWRTEGETRSTLLPGYGADKKFGKGMSDPTWLPDLSGENRTLVNRIFMEDPELAAAWTAQYEGNMEWGKRGYMKALLQQNLVPRLRASVDPRDYHSE